MRPDLAPNMLDLTSAIASGGGFGLHQIATPLSRRGSIPPRLSHPTACPGEY